MNSNVYTLCFWSLVSTIDFTSIKGIHISLKGKIIPDHGLVDITDIGFSEQDSLACHTDLFYCCEENNLGEWYYPDYRSVHRLDSANNINSFFISRGERVVRLHRKQSPKSSGIFRCEMPDTTSFPSSLTAFIGIYPSGSGSPQIRDITVDSVGLTINCFTSGGPITEYHWYKNSKLVRTTDSEYSMYRYIIDFHEAMYLISLKVDSKTNLIGNFTCSVNNTVGMHERTIVVNSDLSRTILPGCSSLFHHHNGRLTLSTGFHVESVASYQCNHLYRLSDLNSVVKCMENGSWSGLNSDGYYPDCVRDYDCKTGIHLYKGLQVTYSDQHRENSVARFSCSSGYRLRGSTEPIVCRLGKWDGAPPHCEVLCKTVQNFPNGRAHINGPPIVGSVISFTCNPKHELSGTTPQTCLPSGNWSDASPVCMPWTSKRKCGTLPLVTNLKINYTGRNAMYSCEKGHTLMGINMNKCHKNGTWAEKGVPFCKLGAKDYHLHKFTAMLLLLLLILL